MSEPGYSSPAMRVVALQQIARDYASFSRSRSGLGNVLGGGVGLVVFVVNALLGVGALDAVLTVGLTALWLVGKELIRRRLYRGYGDAEEIWNGQPQANHRLGVAALSLVALVFLGMLVAGGWLTKAVAIPYLLFCVATPWIAWRYLHTVHEMSLGLGLLFMSAVAASGHTPFLLALLIVPAYALAMIPLGLAEHRQFLALQRRLPLRGDDLA